MNGGRRRLRYLWGGLGAALVFCLAGLALAGCSSTRSAGGPVDDAAITAAIKAKLAADGDINPFNIDVDTNEGVVTLQGRMTERGRKRAEELASETAGVRRVVNLIQAEGGSDSGGGCPAGTCPCSDGECRESCC